jgi:hypothetical protein
MDNDIFFLINILKDNNYVKKVDEEFNLKVSDMLLTDSLEKEIPMKDDGNPFFIELNGFRNTSDLDNYLLESLAKFKSIAIGSGLFKNKVLQNELTQRVFTVRTELGELKLVNIKSRFSNYIPLIDLKINYCDKTLDFISNIKNETSRLGGKKIGDHTELTQKQVAILFHYLKELGYAGKRMDNDDFTQLVAEITDYSSEQIRQDFSRIKKISKIDRFGFQETDFDLVKKSLRRMIQKLDEESKIKF